MLHKIREAELAATLQFFPSGASLLEVGAGTGWQAQLLASRGFIVTAIDISSSNYKADRVWPVVEYDGAHIPAEANCFDVIFSSNTLEHIAEIKSFLLETRRVLKDGGISVHILPTSTWRLASFLGHYLRLDRIVEEFGGLLRSVMGRPVIRQTSADYCQSQLRSPGGVLRRALRRMLPPRHGERGNLFSEHYYFTEHCWKRVFASAGFDVTSVKCNHLFYTGHFLLADRIPLSTRRILSKVLGSTCKIYVLKKSIHPRAI